MKRKTATLASGGVAERFNAAVLKTVVGFGSPGVRIPPPPPPGAVTFFVYVLRSERDGRLYTGVTKDLTRRMREHNAGKTRSLRGRQPLTLVYLEPYVKSKDARARERFFKTPGGGALKQRLVKGQAAWRSPD